MIARQCNPLDQTRDSWHAYIAHVLQRHSRMHGVALEGLTLRVEVLSRAAPPDAAGSQHTQQVRSSV